MIQEDETFQVQLILSIKVEFPAFECIRISWKCNTSLAREQWGLGQLKCSMGRMECYKGDVYRVGKHYKLDIMFSKQKFRYFIYIYTIKLCTKGW